MVDSSGHADPAMGLQFPVNVKSDGANPTAQDIGTALERDGKWYQFFRFNGGIALG